MARMPDTLPGGAIVARRGGVRIPETVVRADGLVRAIDNIAAQETARVQRDQDDSDRLDLIKAQSQFRAAEAEQLAKDGDALADDDVDGFADRYSQSAQERAAVAAGQLSERIRPQFEAGVTEIVTGQRLRALDVERGRREVRQTRALTDQVEAGRQAVFTDATQFDAVLAAADQAISSSGLSEAAQAAWRERLPRDLAAQRFVGLARSAPERALADLDDPRWRAVLTADQVADLQDMAKRQRAQLDAEAAEAVEPLAAEAINRVVSKPAAFEAEMAAFRARPELARLSTAARTGTIRKVAGDLAEARLMSVGEGDPWRARQELLGGRHDSYIAPADKQRLLRGFNGEIEQRQAQARAEAEARAREQRILDRMSVEGAMIDELKAVETAGAAPPVPRARIVAAFGGGPVALARADEHAKRRVEIKQRWADLSLIRALPPAQARALVEERKPKPGVAGYADALASWQSLAKVTDEVMTRRRTDPAGEALARPQVRQLYDAWRATGAPSARAAYERASRAAQSALGVAPAAQSTVPQSIIDGLAAEVAAIEPARRAQALPEFVKQQAEMWGGDANEVLARVGAAAQAPHLGALAPIAGQAGADRLARALATPTPKTDLKEDQNRRIAAATAAALKPLAQSLGSDATAASQLAAAREAIEAAARAEVLAGADPTAAATGLARLYTDQYVFAAGGVRAPKAAGLSRGDLQRGAEMLRQSLADKGGVALRPSNPALQGRARSDNIRGQVLAETMWVTTPDDRGLILMHRQLGQPVPGSDGEPIIVGWDDLRAATTRASAWQMNIDRAKRDLEGVGAMLGVAPPEDRR
jgi:hypothetical protein